MEDTPPPAPCTSTHPVPGRGGIPPVPSSHRSGRELAAPASHTRDELWHPLPPPQTGRPHPRCTPLPPVPQELRVTWGKAGVSPLGPGDPVPNLHQRGLSPPFPFPKQLTQRRLESRGSNPLAPEEPPRMGFCEGGLQSSGKGLGMEGREVA